MGKKILIVDDAAFMRMMIKNIVTKNGYEVVGEAENARVALQLYQEHKPDLVTMDITMPEMGGIDGVKPLGFDPTANIINAGHGATGDGYGGHSSWGQGLYC